AVAVSPYVMHRHPAFWEEPETFMPERFTPERTSVRHRFAYIPFAAGPRQCIGNTFALTEAQLVLAIVAAQHYLPPPPAGPGEKRQNRGNSPYLSWRRGRRPSSPPQFGQVVANACVHAGQNVH